MNNLTKKELREKLIKQLNELDEEYILDSSNKIFSKIINLEIYKNAKTIFIYLSTEKEVQTKNIIKESWKKNKKICVPLIVDNGIMKSTQLNNFNNLTKNKFGIYEPNNYVEVKREEIDLAIVPCLSANIKGERLGYGGGYYDRFLEDTNIPTICVCHERQMLDDIPIEKKDVIMDIVIF